MRNAIQFLIGMFLIIPLQAEVLKVRHDHDPWGGCRGELVISETGIEFKAEKEKHSRQWKWTDIQTFDRQSKHRFSILTWEDQRLLLGLDRYFDFTVPPEEEALSPEAFQIVTEHLPRPILDRIVENIPYDYSVPVKHLHSVSGCEGVLYFGKESIVYQTEHPEHARTWKRDRDVGSVWSLHRYQLEIHVFEENRREFDKTRRYRFQLKEPLDEKYYYQLRREFLPVQ